MVHVAFCSDDFERKKNIIFSFAKTIEISRYWKRILYSI